MSDDLKKGNEHDGSRLEFAAGKWQGGSGPPTARPT